MYQMKKNILFTILFISLSTLVLFCCKKSNDEQPINSEVGLSDSALSLWNSLGVDTFTKIDDLTFDDGSNIKNYIEENEPGFISSLRKMGPTSTPDPLKLLIGNCQIVAAHLAERSNYPFSNGQNGIAYVYGAKDYTILNHCTDDKKNKITCLCTDNLYGLDCSGYIYQIFKIFGLEPIPNPLLAGTAAFADINVWNDALKKSTTYSELILEDKKQLKYADLKVGDIIIHSGDHVGIILNAKDGTKKLFHSAGSWKNSCLENLSNERGPVIAPTNGVQLTDAYLISLFDGSYHVLRFSNPSQPTNPTYNIGDKALGGTIFYLDATKQHGLVAASQDQSSAIEWDANAIIGGVYNPVIVGATGAEIGDGKSNTTAIIATLGSGGKAAAICQAYNGGGYSDWFLPSAQELHEMITKTSIGLDPNKCYWSSTEFIGSLTFGNSGANYDCLIGGGGVGNKNATDAVRAIRSF